MDTLTEIPVRSFPLARHSAIALPVAANRLRTAATDEESDAAAEGNDRGLYVVPDGKHTKPLAMQELKIRVSRA
jgi:hypothetical protein